MRLVLPASPRARTPLEFRLARLQLQLLAIPSGRISSYKDWPERNMRASSLVGGSGQPPLGRKGKRPRKEIGAKRQLGVLLDSSAPLLTSCFFNQTIDLISDGCGDRRHCRCANFQHLQCQKRRGRSLRSPEGVVFHIGSTNMYAYPLRH
jgi:hypothetical protein